MKELYRDAEMDVVKFTVTDVITTSGGLRDDEGPTAPPPPGWG